MITIEEVRQYYDWFSKSKALDESPVNFAKSSLASLAISQHEEIERLREELDMAKRSYYEQIEEIGDLLKEAERLRAANKDLQAWFDDLKAEFDKVRPVVDAAKEFSGEHHLWSTTKPTAYMVEDESRLLRAKTNLVLLARALKTGEPK